DRAARRRQPGADALHESPDASEEPAHPLDALITPVEIALGRGGEEAEQAHGVGTVPFDHRIRVDDVALRLAHLVAVLDRQSLGEQVAERLVEREETKAAPNLAG